jgi:DNA polymerase III delta subunit
MLANRFEKLYRIVVGKLSGQAEIAKKLGISPWEARFLVDAARNFSAADLSAILETIASETHSAHATGGDPSASVERIVFAICGGTRSNGG